MLEYLQSVAVSYLLEIRPSGCMRAAPNILVDASTNKGKVFG